MQMERMYVHGNSARLAAYRALQANNPRQAKLAYGRIARLTHVRWHPPKDDGTPGQVRPHVRVVDVLAIAPEALPELQKLPWFESEAEFVDAEKARSQPRRDEAKRRADLAEEQRRVCTCQHCPVHKDRYRTTLK